MEEIDPVHLQSAYQILQGFINQQKYANIKVDENLIARKIENGIKQLDEGPGSDFRVFLEEMNTKYGCKK